MAETNQVKWVGIRPTLPEESIPIKRGAEEKKSTPIKGGNIIPVGTTSTIILTSNSLRISFYLENAGASAIYIFLGSPALITHLALSPGDFLTGDNYTGIISGIVAAGSENIYALEV